MHLKVFITGIAGFLGSRIAEDLVQCGHQVMGCDNLLTGTIENLPSDVEFFKLDCLDGASLQTALKNTDVLIHAACLPYEGLSPFSPSLISLNTFQASVSVFTSAINAGVRKIVYCSSMARYGHQPSVPFREVDMAKPVDPYGVCKLSAEQVLKILCELHGLEYTILVPHNILGRKQRYDDPFRNVCGIMINSMLMNTQPIIFGDGSQRRCFTDVRDILPCFRKVVSGSSSNGEIINIGPDEEFVSILSLAEIIADVVGFKNLNPLFVPARPTEVPEAYCDASKSRDLLGYVTNYNLRESIEDLAAWVEEMGPRPFRYLLDIELKSQNCPRVWTERYYESQ